MEDDNEEERRAVCGDERTYAGVRKEGCCECWRRLGMVNMASVVSVRVRAWSISGRQMSMRGEQGERVETGRRAEATISGVSKVEEQAPNGSS